MGSRKSLYQPRSHLIHRLISGESTVEVLFNQPIAGSLSNSYRAPSGGEV